LILEEPLFGDSSHPRIDWKWIFNGVPNDGSGHSTSCLPFLRLTNLCSKKKCDQKINNFHTFFGPNLHTHLIYHSRTWKENTHPHAYRGWTIPDSLFWGTYTQLLPRGGIRWTADHDYFWGFDSPSYRSKLRAVVVFFLWLLVRVYGLMICYGTVAGTTTS